MLDVGWLKTLETWESSGELNERFHLSSVENPGWLFDIGDYTTQLYGEYNKPL